ncbi:MAG: septum formation initiator family protein [Proteobacteria bacterium]|jgi:cell division protein FtsB|nr:septum formation initiator family protein [Pseudomonadota bacterium]
MRPVLLAVALVCAAVGYAWIVPESGFPTWLRLRDEVTQAEDRIRTLERQNTVLRDEVAALRVDSFAQERAVREELGWVRPGETLVRVSGGGAPSERSVP